MIIKLISKGGGFFFPKYYSKIDGEVLYGEETQRHKSMVAIRRVK